MQPSAPQSDRGLDTDTDTDTDTDGFNKNTDLLLANFDLKPDDDDVMAAAVLGSMLRHPDLAGVNYFAVAGAYGTQDYTFISIAVPDFFNILFGAENDKWTNADANWSESVTRAQNKVKAVLDAGGKVFVQEAGQSDFTYDVLQAAIADGVSLSTVEAKVTVVQHSGWNQNNSTDAKLDWLRSHTVYYKIDDGNTSDNDTPAYKDEDNTWMDLATSDSNPNAEAREIWTMADEICDDWTTYNNPAIRVGGVDFSDCVENWYIFDIGNDADDVDSFWSRYVTNDD